MRLIDSMSLMYLSNRSLLTANLFSPISDTASSSPLLAVVVVVGVVVMTSSTVRVSMVPSGRLSVTFFFSMPTTSRSYSLSPME